MPSRPIAQLLAASFVTLATELVLIRWIPGQVRVIAYFPNLILLAAFLGIGAGCFLSCRLPLWTWPLLLIVLAAAVTAMSRVAFTQQSTSEFLWLLYFDLPRDAPVFNGVRLPILIVFVLSAITFVPLGGYIADRLNFFKQAERPLTGYAADLTGSLLGVVALTIILVSGAVPVVWFGVILIPAAFLYVRSLRSLLIFVAAGAVLLILVGWNDRAQYYSPYYAISVVPQKFNTFDVLTNGSVHQEAVPLKRELPPASRTLGLVRAGYHLPYRLLRREPRHVLILGAGTGNDVSVAIDERAERVDAVEIDPQILRLGAQHPDRPYDSPRVRAVNTDAREFLNYSEEKYDLIVFGTLDSMTRLSALSNVRLDNYVYTVECLEAARRHLTPDGGIVMLFMVGTPYIEEHISALLVRALDERPVVIRQYFFLFNRIFLAGPAFRHMAERAPLERLREAAALEAVPTDDWPFLYLRDRALSPFYVSIIGAILGITTLTVFGLSREMRQSVATRQVDVVMFLFGVAFLLTETKLVTEMNLVWGATWLASSIVFASILLTILLGTIWTSRAELSWPLCAGGLLVSLMISWAVPVRIFVGRAFGTRLAASIAFIGLPMLFASMCFAFIFRRRERVDVAFGWNMLGAVVGGLLEFSSMVFGIKAMTLLAVATYLIAILLIQRRSVDAHGS